VTRSVLVLHGYSAENAGDGLLVKETLGVVREAIPQSKVTLLASRPETFAEVDGVVLPTVPTKRGWDKRTRRALRNIDDYDLIVAVGGGYLRAGNLIEAAKTGLVHLPQLRAAAGATKPTVYLPQSVGPARLGTARYLARLLRRIDVVMLRDDRSVAEFGGANSIRVPDLATAAIADGRRPGAEVDPVPVLSIRSIRNKVNPDIYRLASAIGAYDGYIQSTTGGNDDRAASATLDPRHVLDRAELMGAAVPRVVVAVRLHAALMALAAGHYVVHLAYERKGFGAFGDLDLGQWVHSVNSFDLNAVAAQVKSLLGDASVRDDYDKSIRTRAAGLAEARRDLVQRIARAGGQP
jgi:polysaccharide pyruvyl transferase WcaK-like protein